MIVVGVNDTELPLSVVVFLSNMVPVTFWTSAIEVILFLPRRGFGFEFGGSESVFFGLSRDVRFQIFERLEV